MQSTEASSLRTVVITSHDDGMKNEIRHCFKDLDLRNEQDTASSSSWHVTLRGNRQVKVDLSGWREHFNKNRARDHYRHSWESGMDRS